MDKLHEQLSRTFSLVVFVFLATSIQYLSNLAYPIERQEYLCFLSEFNMHSMKYELRSITSEISCMAGFKNPFESVLSMSSLHANQTRVFQRIE